MTEIRSSRDGKFDLFVKKKRRIPQQNNLGHNVLWITGFSAEEKAQTTQPRSSPQAPQVLRLIKSRA